MTDIDTTEATDQATDARKPGDQGVRPTHPTEPAESQVRGAAKKSDGVDSADPISDDATEKPDDEPESFPREYVERLRQEAAEARVKAKTAETLAQRLHVSLVAADGRLVAPDELPFDAEHLDNPEALNEAISALIASKPYLAARRVRGDVGQGEKTADGGAVDLAGILRARA